MPSYVRPGIRKCAKNRALSEQVAATLNVSVSTVSRIVNYKRDLSMRRAMILHTEYGIPFDVMYPSQLSEGEGVFVR